MINWSLPKYEYAEPLSVEEAVSILKENPRSTLKAGGTDLLVKMRRREIEPELIVNLRRIAGLKGVDSDQDEGLTVGATTTVNQLLMDPRVVSWHGLADAARSMGTPQIRNLATVGGNICNGSPVADVAAALISYGATAKVKGGEECELCPVEKLAANGGHGTGMVTQIHLPPLGKGTVGAFLKYTATRGSSFSLVNCAITVRLDQGSSNCVDCRIVFGGVAPSLIRASHAEGALVGGDLSEALFEKACEVLPKDLSPITDSRASAEYRLHLSQLLLRQSFGILSERTSER